MLSFNFDYGLNQIWQTIRKGATLYLHNLALPNDLFALLAAEKITALPVMPVIITKMFDQAAEARDRLARFLLSALCMLHGWPAVGGYAPRS